MKRSLRDEATDYAAELLSGPSQRRTKLEHVVEVLTRQHGGRYPVAVNQGTRPFVCGVLKRQLGAEYEKLCVAAEKSAPAAVPAALPATSAAAAAVPTLAAMRSRFPATAAPLLEHGAQLLPLLQPKEVASLAAALAAHSHGKERALSPAQGNGDRGCYTTLDAPLPPLLRVAMDAARQWIEETAGPLKRGLCGKALLLRYGEGGVNYAHRDGCGDFQGLIMLSSPGVDYNGGALYLADSNPPFRTTEFPFASAGELLIFRGNRGNGAIEYLHGLTPVTRGSGAETRRFAVGLFQ